MSSAERALPRAQISVFRFDGPGRRASLMRLFQSPRTPTAALVVLLASTTVTLTGCGQDAGNEGAENNTTENVQVMLPPSIHASHPYRCEDNSVAPIEFPPNDVPINLRSEGNQYPTTTPPPR